MPILLLANLQSGNLGGADLSGSNLTNVNFYRVNMSGANLSGAIINGANFKASTNLDRTQIYSTANYSQKNLAGINFSNLYLPFWNFAGQNLTNAIFQSSRFDNVDFSLADMRGATFSNNTGTFVMCNTIGADGTISGLNLLSGDCLVVRDFSMAIMVKNAMTMANDSILKIILADNNWESLINIDSGVTPLLSGTLDLNFADERRLSESCRHRIQTL